MEKDFLCPNLLESTKHQRNCPTCNISINYSDKYKLQRAITNNTGCSSCRQRSHKKQDIYFKNCPVCGILMSYTNYGSFLSSLRKNNSCYKCYTKKLSEQKIDTTETFIEKSKLLHGDKYDYSKTIYGKNSHKKVIIICKKHGEFLQQPNNHLQGKGCSICTHIISKLETEFLNFLNIKERNVRLKEWNKKPVDGLDKLTNTVYEFLGDYWHGNPSVFNSSKINKDCKKTFGELYEMTFKRLNKVKSLGYNVKYIWEKDWSKFNKGVDKTPNIITL